MFRHRPMLLLVIVLLWLAAGLYLGSAGWVGTKAFQSTSVVRATSTPQMNDPAYIEFEGLLFKDERNLRDFLQERTYRWFSWIFEIPQNLIPVVACIGFGLFGGAGRLLKELALDKAKRAPLDAITYPLFGAVIGVLIAFMSVAVPNVLVTGETTIRPETLLVFSLAGGLFAEEVYPWIGSNVISKLFGKHNYPSPKDRGQR